MTKKKLLAYQRKGMLVTLTYEIAKDLSDLNCDILNYRRAKDICLLHGKGKLSCWKPPLNYWTYNR